MQRQIVEKNTKSIDETDCNLVNLLLFASSRYEYHIHSKIISFSIYIILNTENYFENSAMLITQIYELFLIMYL